MNNHNHYAPYRLSFQTYICPVCFDDHSEGNHERCADNLSNELDRHKKALDVAMKYIDMDGGGQMPDPSVIRIEINKILGKEEGNSGKS